MFRCPRANSIDVLEMSGGILPHLVICPTRQSSDTIFNYRWVRFGVFSSEEFARSSPTKISRISLFLVSKP
jgi:hypothetical protein